MQELRATSRTWKNFCGGTVSTALLSSEANKSSRSHMYQKPRVKAPRSPPPSRSYTPMAASGRHMTMQKEHRPGHGRRQSKRDGRWSRKRKTSLRRPEGQEERPRPRPGERLRRLFLCLKWRVERKLIMLFVAEAVFLPAECVQRKERRALTTGFAVPSTRGEQKTR